MSLPGETAFFAHLRTHEAAFRAGLPAMLAQLDVTEPGAAPACAQALELQRQLHMLAGGAATLGYYRLGSEARVLEQRLCVLRAFEAVPDAHWRDWFSALAAMLDWARVDPRAGQGAGASLKLL